jgi:hypothetical protein
MQLLRSTLDSDQVMERTELCTLIPRNRSRISAISAKDSALYQLMSQQLGGIFENIGVVSPLLLEI